MLLCCGEALIDMIPEATVSGKTGFVPYCGGAVFNTAIALGRQGVPTGLLTGLSRDIFGQQLLNALDASNVSTDLSIRSSRPTTLALVQLENGQARYSFIDENSAGRMLKASDMPVIGEEISALYFGGISLACEPCADAYASFLAQEGAARAVMLDPNIRPDFISDETRYRRRLEMMIARADIIKVSDEDLDWIRPEQQAIADKAKALLQEGPALVIVTEGAKGASAFLKDGAVVTVTSPKVKVVDTVGAGDTFNAGFLARLYQRNVLNKTALASLDQDTARAAIELGAQTAAITVSRAGANPPWASEL